MWALNDFDFDCLQKKRLAQQAKHRKCGSKSKKCSLSSDNLTLKQWKERCGKTVSVSLNKPASWENFKSLSKQSQEEYLRGLMETYGANATSLAYMFGVKPLTIRRYITSKDLDIAFQVGHSMSAAQRVAWDAFVSGAENTTEDTQCDDENNPEQVQKGMCMKQFSICFSGKIDISMISNSLIQILGNGASGNVEIVCNLDC